MTTRNFKLESGLQLLARLTKSSELGDFYSHIFNDEHELIHNDIIEVSGENNSGKSILLIDIACEALMPTKYRGIAANVIVFSTDGNFNFELFSSFLKEKINSCCVNENNAVYSDINSTLYGALENFYFIDTFNALQFYASIQNLETILQGLSRTTIILFDSLIAYYWSEQLNRMTRMDTYIASIIKMIQKVTKEYKPIIFYTKPSYFRSKFDIATCKNEQTKEVKYRIKLLCSPNSSSRLEHKVLISTVKDKTEKTAIKSFYVIDNKLKWISN